MLVAGGIWGYYAWGTYWLWTPKELWTSILWLFYALWLHLRLQGLDGVRDCIEALAQGGKQALPGRREINAPRASDEQARLQVFFEKSYLMADCRRRQRQLRRGMLEAQVAGGRFEGAQRGQGWQSTCAHA